MTENDKIRDLEAQARNTKHYIDRLNMAYYGMTWDEFIRYLGNWKEDEDGERGYRSNDKGSA